MRLQKACQLYSLCPRLSRTRQVVSPSPGNMLQHMGQNRDSVLLSLDCTSFRRCMGHTAAIPRRATTPLLRSHEFSLPPLQVRPHEVDQYSVVNNAVFVQYLQHGMLLSSACTVSSAESLHHHWQICCSETCMASSRRSRGPERNSSLCAV